MCLIVLRGRTVAGGSCVSRSILASRGAATVVTSVDGVRRVTGPVGDGMDRVATRTGTSTRVHNNVFSLPLRTDMASLRFSGPAGSFDVAIAEAEPRPHEARFGRPVPSSRFPLCRRRQGGRACWGDRRRRRMLDPAIHGPPARRWLYTRRRVRFPRHRDRRCGGCRSAQAGPGSTTGSILRPTWLRLNWTSARERPRCVRCR